MLIVAIDTSGKNGSIGLFGYNADAPGIALAGQAEPLTGGSYSAELIPKLTQLLARGNHYKSDIDAFVVVSGPGSFTGLRVGLSTVKALADALNKPIAAVSVLEAVAVQSAASGNIVVAVDAGRKQLYVADFHIDGRNYRALNERLLDIAQFNEELNHSSATVFTADTNVAEFLRPSGRSVFLVPQPTAAVYASIGAERILAGHTVSPAELDANYIRRSDAELFKSAR